MKVLATRNARPQTREPEAGSAEADAALDANNNATSELQIVRKLIVSFGDGAPAPPHKGRKEPPALNRVENPKAGEDNTQVGKKSMKGKERAQDLGELFVVFVGEILNYWCSV